MALEHAAMRVNVHSMSADGRSRSRKVLARNCRGRGPSCMPAGLAIFFFFLDPRIFEDSNGSSADPDRSGFRWIRFIPTSYALLTYSIFLHAQFLFLHGGSLGKMSDPVRSVIPECKGLNSPDPVRKAGGFDFS